MRHYYYRRGGDVAATTSPREESGGGKEGGEGGKSSSSSSNVRTISSLAQIRELIENSAAPSSSISSFSLHDEGMDNNAAGGALIVLDFTSNNCPPCDMIRPIYDELSLLDEFVDATARGSSHRPVVFCKVNVSDHPDIAKYYGVDGWPTFLFFRDGALIDSVVGGNAARVGLYGLISKHARSS
ncbi:hypothetical protein ACHAXA_005114 [Cyclostephanos tholiformis]|uniref:Thioredoxin domain-containing protein n=1 Tax=Cyclostephanos tholiformis TaxID=382380 RepID=A0ABD3RXD2_9STRA